MNRREQLERALDSIHMPDDVRERTLEVMRRQRKRVSGDGVARFFAIAAACVMLLTGGYFAGRHLYGWGPDPIAPAGPVESPMGTPGIAIADTLITDYRPEITVVNALDSISVSYDFTAERFVRFDSGFLDGIAVYRDAQGENTYISREDGHIFALPAQLPIGYTPAEKTLTFMHSSALSAPQPAFAAIVSQDYLTGVTVSAEGSSFTPMIFRDEEGGGWLIRLLDTENKAKTVARAVMSPDGLWSVEWVDDLPAPEPSPSEIITPAIDYRPTIAIIPRFDVHYISAPYNEALPAGSNLGMQFLYSAEELDAFVEEYGIYEGQGYDGVPVSADVDFSQKMVIITYERDSSSRVYLPPVIDANNIGVIHLCIIHRAVPTEAVTDDIMLRGYLLVVDRDAIDGYRFLTAIRLADSAEDYDFESSDYTDETASLHWEEPGARLYRSADKASYYIVGASDTAALRIPGRADRGVNDMWTGGDFLSYENYLIPEYSESVYFAIFLEQMEGIAVFAWEHEIGIEFPFPDGDHTNRIIVKNHTSGTEQAVADITFTPEDGWQITWLDGGPLLPGYAQSYTAINDAFGNLIAYALHLDMHSVLMFTDGTVPTDEAGEQYTLAYGEDGYLIPAQGSTVVIFRNGLLGLYDVAERREVVTQ